MEKEFYKAADKNLTACVLLSGRADICTIHQSKCWERKILLNIKSVDDRRTIFKFLHVMFTLRVYEKPGKKSAKLMLLFSTAFQYSVSTEQPDRSQDMWPQIQMWLTRLWDKNWVF